MGEGADVIRFSVSYRLREYVSFALEHERNVGMLEQTLAARGLKLRPLPALVISFLLGAAAWFAWARAYTPLAAALTIAALAAFVYGAAQSRLFFELLGRSVATLAFFSKKRRIGTCDFAIDARQIRRCARDGELVVQWHEVRRVYRYSHGYLLERATGSIAIPSRCMTQDQLDRFAALLRSQTATGPGVF